MRITEGERLGRRLRQLRLDRELTLDEAAARLNRELTGGSITGSTVGQIERGSINVPSAPVLRAFARSYNVSLESLERLLPGGAMPMERARVDEAVKLLEERLSEARKVRRTAGGYAIFDGDRRVSRVFPTAAAAHRELEG